MDLIAKTITVKQQTCYGITTTPKGRTRLDRTGIANLQGSDPDLF